ncbi:MAG: CPBP family intramembrane glutamic endopeptidase [Anaerovoracaceae bacterium]
MLQQLYKKDELWFAIIFIIIYVVGTSITDNISRDLGVAKSLTTLFLIVLSGSILLFIKKNKLSTYYGLCKPNLPAQKLLFYIPLILLIVPKLIFGVQINYSPIETIFFILSMLFVGFLEEVIFRGFLFKALCKDNVKTAIIVSSLTFGIGHIVNLINGSGSDLISTLCQICYAISIGFMFVMLFYRTKSLWSCIILHGVYNSTSAFTNHEMINTYIIPGTIAIIVISLGYSLFLIKNTPQP